MNHFLKKIGYAKRPEGFLISEVEQNDCLFWESESCIYFGNTIPQGLKPGDILIQEVSSSLSKQNHAIIGIYKCISAIQRVPIGPHTCEEEKGKWTSYIKAENLTPKFSLEMKNRLEKNKSVLLNLQKEWKVIGESRLPYYGAGWAYVNEEKAQLIMEKINQIESALHI